MPLVSVGLPTRNRAELLPRALESLLGQTYRNIEYIISDNASTDATPDIIHSFALKDSRIRSIRQERDINGMENHEFVLREARGKYFMWANDDDWWSPRFVEKLVDVLEKNPEYGVAMSHYRKRFINDSNPRTERVAHEYTNLSHHELYWKYIRGRVTAVFFFGLYRTEVLKKIFRRKPPSFFNGLMLTLAEVALATRCYSVPEVLHEQLQDARIHIIRHPAHPYTIGELDPFAVTRYTLMIPLWLMTSSAIPLVRKRLIFFPWVRRAWLYKRKIVREVWRFLKYLIIPADESKSHIEELFSRWLSSTNYVILADTLFLFRKLARQNKQSVLSGIRQQRDRMKGAAGAVPKLADGESAEDALKRLQFLETHLN